MKPTLIEEDKDGKEHRGGKEHRSVSATPGTGMSQRLKAFLGELPYTAELY